MEITLQIIRKREQNIRFSKKYFISNRQGTYKPFGTVFVTP